MAPRIYTDDDVKAVEARVRELHAELVSMLDDPATCAADPQVKAALDAAILISVAEPEPWWRVLSLELIAGELARTVVLNAKGKKLKNPKS